MSRRRDTSEVQLTTLRLLMKQKITSTSASVLTTRTVYLDTITFEVTFSADGDTGECTAEVTAEPRDRLARDIVDRAHGETVTRCPNKRIGSFLVEKSFVLDMAALVGLAQWEGDIKRQSEANRLPLAWLFESNRLFDLVEKSLLKSIAILLGVSRLEDFGDLRKLLDDRACDDPQMLNVNAYWQGLAAKVLRMTPEETKSYLSSLPDKTAHIVRAALAKTP